MFNILIVEDDLVLNRSMTSFFSKNGFKPFSAENADKALDIIDHEHIDIVICDVMMPGMDGYELTHELRGAYPTLPIMIVTARDSYNDKQRGFTAGTDDYMVKPIELGELLLRVNALLRRAQIVHERKITVGSTTLYYDSLEAVVGEESMILPQKEFYLLYLLLSYAGKTFTRNQLMDEIWGPDSYSDARTVDVHINKIRDHFKGSEDFEVITVRGLGYKAVKKK